MQIQLFADVFPVIADGRCADTQFIRDLFGSLPHSDDVEDLFQRQARETDTKKREALLHQIQSILHERVTHIPIYELAFIWGVGPRVEEPGINLIRSFAYSGPLEDLRVKRP